MLVPYTMFPPDIVKEYNICTKVNHRGMVLAKIIKGMYGLPQAGRLAYDQLTQHLQLAGYVPTGQIPGLFKHLTRPIYFTLVVDDFGAKFVSKDDVLHRINHLKKKYLVTTDWEGKLFCGISLDWDYAKWTVRLYMPHYVKKALLRFRYQAPNKPQHSPHTWNALLYGAKTQFTTPIDPHFTQLTPKQKTYVQEVIGTFLFYARVIDSTMLPAVGRIATNLAISPFTTLKQTIYHFLNYAATHPNVSVKYVASQMHLWAHSDASYLASPNHVPAPEASITSVTNPLSSSKPPTPSPPPMAPSTSFAKSLTPSCPRHKKPKPAMRTTLEELGHNQGLTPIQFNNKVATGIMSDNIEQKRSKSMDMRFYCLRDRQR
jgi:hypothetical protein